MKVWARRKLKELARRKMEWVSVKGKVGDFGAWSARLRLL